MLHLTENFEPSLAGFLLNTKANYLRNAEKPVERLLWYLFFDSPLCHLPIKSTIERFIGLHVRAGIIQRLPACKDYGLLPIYPACCLMPFISWFLCFNVKECMAVCSSGGSGGRPSLSNVKVWIGYYLPESFDFLVGNQKTLVDQVNQEPLGSLWLHPTFSAQSPCCCYFPRQASQDR